MARRAGRDLVAVVSDRVHELAIVGSGFGGIGAAIVAGRQGIDDLVIVERADSVGGTWRDNTYPGCACDIPSHLYSFSFAQNPEWSRSYPAQPELRAYLERVVDEHHLRSRIRFGSTVVELRWLDDDRHWVLALADGGSLRARSVVVATGPLSQPASPDIPGLDDFEGKLFHSARWDHHHRLDGAHVAVIGTGASAIQLVPEIADEASRVEVFQRTPSWVLPRDDRPAPHWRRRLYRSLPFLQRLHRWRIYFRQELLAIAFLGSGRVAISMRRRLEQEVRAQIDAVIDDPVLAQALVPSYTPGCKRVLISNDWYPTLARHDVDLVTEPIVRVERDGIRTADGELHRCDTIVLATGFAVTTFPEPMRILGRGGEDLVDHWVGGAATHLGLAVNGFPNLWFLAGPGTGLGHNSIVFMIEAQLHTIGAALGHCHRGEADVIEVRSEREQRSYSELQRRIDRTVWTSGCTSWYRSDDGRVDTIWPGTTIEYWLRTRRFRVDDFDLTPRRTVAARFGRPGADR